MERAVARERERRITRGGERMRNSQRPRQNKENRINRTQDVINGRN